MFTFTLAFFAGHQHFSLHFQSLSAIYAERERRNLEESSQKENHWPQLLHLSGTECQIDHFVCFAAQFSSSPKQNSFQNLEENLWTINQKTEFPDFSLTLTISTIFPDFSLTMATLRRAKCLSDYLPFEDDIFQSVTWLTQKQNVSSPNKMRAYDFTICTGY